MGAINYGLGFGVFMAAFVTVYYLFVLGVAVLQYVALWKILVKAGEPGWKCLVPFYSGYTMYKTFWKPLYYWLTLLFGVAVCVLITVWSILITMLPEPPVGFTLLTWTAYVAFFVVVVVWSVKFSLNMSRAFGHGGAFAAGLIFLPLIFMLILAFGGDVYRGNPSVQHREFRQDPPQEPWNAPPAN